MKNRKRQIPILFWVSEEEREQIEQKMAQLGTGNMSAYLRKIAIDGYVVNLDLPELRELGTAWNLADYGVRADGTVQTRAIQAVIDRAAAGDEGAKEDAARRQEQNSEAAGKDSAAPGTDGAAPEQDGSQQDKNADDDRGDFTFG